MENRKLFGLFSGAQLTCMVCAAIVTPGAVYAVTFTSVVITDPGTGKQAAVDSGRRLYTYDPVAGLANNPVNLVQISGETNSLNLSTIYTVPAGKALILKSVNMSAFDGTTGNDNFTYFFGNGLFMTGFDDVNANSAHFAGLGSGFFLHAGETITATSSNGSGTAFITEYSFEGYLVPENAVPPAASAEGAQQIVNHGAHKKS